MLCFTMRRKWMFKLKKGRKRLWFLLILPPDIHYMEKRKMKSKSGKAVMDFPKKKKSVIFEEIGRTCHSEPTNSTPGIEQIVSGDLTGRQSSVPLYIFTQHHGFSGSLSQSETSKQPGDSRESSTQLRPVEFDEDAQPVGDESVPYATFLGRLTKTHCPIYYESFKSVPKPTRTQIWKKITDEYEVDEVFKKCQFKKIGKYFREFKYRLRIKYYDKYDNDYDRKLNCPKSLKQEDWERFVDNESKPFRKSLRLKGKASRYALRVLHTSGRRGAARTIHNMRKKNPAVFFLFFIIS